MPTILSGSSVGALAVCFIAAYKYEDLVNQLNVENIHKGGYFFLYKFNTFWEAVSMYLRGVTFLEG